MVFAFALEKQPYFRPTDFVFRTRPLWSVNVNQSVGLWAFSVSMWFYEGFAVVRLGIICKIGTNFHGLFMQDMVFIRYLCRVLK